jgi:hypothetical protein
MRSTVKSVVLPLVLFAASGWVAPVVSGRPPYVVDSLPAPGKQATLSVCFDSSGWLRALHSWSYQQWTDTLIFKIDTADGRVMDSVSIHPYQYRIMRQMTFAYGKFWITGGPSPIYVQKIDTLGRTIGGFLTPVRPPADGNGLCFEGDKLWITSADPFGISGVYQTDTLGNVLRFVRIGNPDIGIPANLAYWPKAPQTLFVVTWQKRLCQITTDDTVARFLRSWPSPFPPDMNFAGSTFDKQGYFWTCDFAYPWILKLDLGLTGVERGEKPGPVFPKELRLYPVVPVPMSSKAEIRFEVSSTSRVKLTLVDIAGSWVRVLNDGVMRPGEYRVVWDGRNDQGQRVPSGVYFLKLEALGQSAVQRVVVVR